MLKRGTAVTPEESDLRRTLVRLVNEAGIFGLRDDNLEEGFIAGTEDPQLSEMGIDSLSEMELCIAIENTFHVSIVPAELQKFQCLGDVLRRIQA
jgi:acyl carrier protein